MNNVEMSFLLASLEMFLNKYRGDLKNSSFSNETKRNFEEMMKSLEKTRSSLAKEQNIEELATAFLNRINKG